MKVPAINFIIAIILAAAGLVLFATNSIGMNVALFIGLCALLSLINATVAVMARQMRLFVPGMILADVLVLAAIKIVGAVWYY